MTDIPDDEVTIPRAALNKMMKEILPHVRVASDARELILNCCTEFVHLISSEANEICNKQSRKTISPEHVLAALDSLGFGEYMNDCKSALEQCKTVAAKKRRGSNRLENLGIPEEELLRQQQELFEKARLEQAAIEHQEWLQLQGAQMVEGQYCSVPGMDPLVAGQQQDSGHSQKNSQQFPGMEYAGCDHQQESGQVQKSYRPYPSGTLPNTQLAVAPSQTSDQGQSMNNQTNANVEQMEFDSTSGQSSHPETKPAS